MQVRKAAEMAISWLNVKAPQGSLWPGCNVTLMSRDTKSNPVVAALATFELSRANPPPAMIIGASRSDVTSSVTIIGQVTRIPTLSYASTSVTLRKADLFARVVGSDAVQCAAILHLMRELWPQNTQGAIISASSQYVTSLVTELRDQAVELGVGISSFQHEVLDTSDFDAFLASVNKALDAIVLTNTRVVIMNNAPAEARLVLSEMQRRNMAGSTQTGNTPYQVIGTDYFSLPSSLLAAGNVTALAQEGCDAACAGRVRLAMPSMLFMSGSSEATLEWLLPWKKTIWDPETGPGQLTPEEVRVSGLSSWQGDAMAAGAPYAFDAVRLAAATLTMSCKEAGVPTSSTGCVACAARWADGDALYATMLNHSSSAATALVRDGATGPIVLNNFGDRPMATDIYVFVASSTAPFGVAERRYAAYIPTPGEPVTSGALLVNSSQANWPGGRSQPPLPLGNCPAGDIATQVNGLTFCQACPQNKYNMDSESVCHDCPDTGALCPGGDLVVMEAGYWSSPLEADGTITTYSCRPLPDVCCPTSNCSAGAMAVTRPWGSSLCKPNRLGPLCADCRAGFSLYGTKCLRCEGVNWAMMAGMLAVAGVGLFLLMRLVPSDRASNRMTLDYVQLLAVILVPVPGGRLPSLSALVGNNIFNLDLASLIGTVDDGNGTPEWQAGTLPTEEPPLPPPLAFCPTPLSPLASAIVPLTLPLTLLVFIILLACVWRRVADRVFPATGRTLLAALCPCLSLASRPQWMIHADAFEVRSASPSSPAPQSPSGGVAPAGDVLSIHAQSGASHPARADRVAAIVSGASTPAGVAPLPPSISIGSTAQAGVSPPQASTVINPLSKLTRMAHDRATGTAVPGASSSTAAAVSKLPDRATRARMRPAGEESDSDDGGALSPARVAGAASPLAEPQVFRVVHRDESSESASEAAGSTLVTQSMDLTTLRREVSRRVQNAEAEGLKGATCPDLPMDVHSARVLRSRRGRDAAPVIQVVSGHYLANEAAVELLAGVCCWWYRLSAKATTAPSSPGTPPSRTQGTDAWVGQTLARRLGGAASRAARHIARQRHWAHVPLSTVLRASLRLATVSANIVTATAWKLLACRDVEGVLVLELQPAVKCWTPEHTLAVVVLGVLLFFFAVGMPVLLVSSYEYLDRRAVHWVDWKRERIRRILAENASRSSSTLARFIQPIAAGDDDERLGADYLLASAVGRWPGRKSTELAEGADARASAAAPLDADERAFAEALEVRREGAAAPAPGAGGGPLSPPVPVPVPGGGCGPASLDPAVGGHSAARVAGARATALTEWEVEEVLRAARQEREALLRRQAQNQTPRRKRLSYGVFVAGLDAMLEPSGGGPGRHGTAADDGNNSHKPAGASSPSSKRERMKGAFVQTASAPDADLTNSAGRALWEVLRVYRPGVRGTYEAIVFVRRVMLTAAVVFLSPVPAWRQIAILCLCMMFLGVHLMLAPFASSWDNGYAGALLVSMVFVAGLETFNTPAYLTVKNHRNTAEAATIAIVEFILIIVPVTIAGVSVASTLRRSGYFAPCGRCFKWARCSGRDIDIVDYKRRLSIASTGLGRTASARLPKESIPQSESHTFEVELGSLARTSRAAVVESIKRSQGSFRK